MRATSTSGGAGADRKPCCVHIVEANGTGHRLYYVRLLAEYALERAQDVTLMLHESCHDSPEFQLHIAPLLPDVSVAFDTRFTLAAIGARSTSIQASVTVIPDADRFIYEIARGRRWRGAGRLSLLAMRERSEPRPTRLQTAAASWLKRRAFSIARYSPRVSVAVLTSGVRSSGRGFRAADPVTFAGTPAASIALREAWAIAPGEFAFGIVGAIDERKNVPLVLDALGIATAGGKIPTSFVLAGRVAGGARASIQAAIVRLPESVKVIMVDRVIDDQEFDSIVGAVDCVVLAHGNDGPSGILGKAVAARTRVLAAGSATLRLDCESIGTGALWVPLSLEGLVSGLVGIRRQPQPNARALATAAQFARVLIDEA